MEKRIHIASAILGLLGTSLCAEQSPSGEDFLFLFLNPSMPGNRFTMQPQIRLAAEAGIAKFTFRVPGSPSDPAKKPGQWQKIGEWMNLFADARPDAQVAPRIPLPSLAGQAGLQSTIVYRSGPSDLLCWTDPAVQDAATKAVWSAVSRYENSPRASRIWGYHLAGRETGEWIPEYRREGLDYSEANVQAFRKWLAEKYGSDEKLRAAWGANDVSLATAGVPIDKERRFPLGATGKRVKVFYSLPEERNWVDYSQFVSDDNARCIRRLARAAKEACSGKKAILVFYGYVFELPSSVCGHLRAREILSDANIDYVAAPISYQPYSQRLEGGPGAPMGAVDSFPLHGKTWINEDDLHTHAQMPGAETPPWYWDSRSPEFRIPPDARATAGILRRNLAFAAFHHAATWWMDLYGGGWFSDPALWNVWSGDFGKKMATVRKTSLPYRPEIAVIVDEESRFYEKMTISGFQQMYPVARNALQGSGASVGFYYLDDYLEDRVPLSPATVFLNAWHLNRERLEKLRSRIAERKGVVIWQYAPGYMNPETGGTAAIEQMTGIKTVADRGNTGSTGRQMLGKIRFGGGFTPDPRIVINDPSAVPLGIYLSDLAVSAAMRMRDGVRHVLVAESNWSPEFVSALFKAAGIPVTASAPAVVQVSDSAVYLYGTRNGNVEATAPVGKAFADAVRKKAVGLKVNESRLLPFVPE